jgi:hypothetical protein
VLWSEPEDELCPPESPAPALDGAATPDAALIVFPAPPLAARIRPVAEDAPWVARVTTDPTDGTEADGTIGTDGVAIEGALTRGVVTDGTVIDGIDPTGVLTEGTVTFGVVRDESVAELVGNAAALPPSG